MKTTGVIRRIDELGRIVIPKEIRRNLGIRDGENIEIFTAESSIILKKHSRLTNVEEIIERLGDLTNSIMNYNIIITDREKVILALGETLEKLKNSLISIELKKLIDSRESNFDNKELSYKFGDIDLLGYFAVIPIIASNDSIGLVIMYNKTRLSNDEIKFCKLFAKLVGDKIDII